VSADPAEHAAVSTAPVQVSATFNEDLQTTFAAMTVVGPDGNLWTAGQPQVHGAVVSVGVRPLGPTGNYTVNYRVTSADGHVVSGFVVVSADDTWHRHTRPGGAVLGHHDRRHPGLAVRRRSGGAGCRRGTVGGAEETLTVTLTS